MDPPLPPPPLLGESARPGMRPASASPIVPDGHDIHGFDLATQNVATLPTFRGVHVLTDFVTEDEARALLHEIERHPFTPSQSGRTKQHFGARVNFNKRRMNVSGFEGLPGYATRLVERLGKRLGPIDDARLAAAFEDFTLTDVFVLRYEPDLRSNLDLHLDDTFAYGDLILDLSLESDSVLTFYRGRPEGEVPVDPDRPAPPACVRVPLPARSLAVIHGPARFEWEHGLLADDIHARRTSVTLRTLSPTLRETKDGRRLIEACHAQRSARRASAS